MSGPKVNLELQMKFLDQLHSAVSDALDSFGGAAEDKVAELEYINREVNRARRIVSTRISEDSEPASSREQADQSVRSQHAAM